MAHPLTDEMVQEVEGRIRDCNLMGVEPDLAIFLRSAYDKGADWQLRQVIDWLCGNLHRLNYLEPVGYSGAKIDVDYVIDNLKEAMRPATVEELTEAMLPTTTQENNS